MLLAIPLGIALGLVLRGRLASLATLRFRWAWLAVAGLLVQVALFTETGDALAGAASPVIYVGSTLAVFLAVVRNLRLTGMPIVALGALSNLAAIVANGGAMPADPAALATAGLPATDHMNSVVLADPALRPLTDIFALPEGMAFANVYSIGDVLIAVGIVVVIAAAMPRPTGDGEPS